MIKQYLIFLVLILISASSFSQGITVTGKVIDETGEVLPGVSILETGT